jgi:hypothetical protein
VYILKLINNKFTKILAISAMAMSFMAPTAFAATNSLVPAGVQVEGGTLDLTADNTAITYDQLRLADLVNTDYVSVKNFADFNVTDSRGTGDGWNVQISATPFVETTSLAEFGVETHMFDTTAMLSNGALIGNSADLLFSETGYSIYSAGVDSGMGSFDFTGLTTELAVEKFLVGQAKAGIYASTISFDLVTGP